LVLFLTLVCASHAARAPNMNTIGADLLVRVAEPCDVTAAWRVLNSSSFSPGWLTAQGAAGETPLMAAVRAGCGQLVAMLTLHPDFDDSTIRRNRQRKDLIDYAMRKNEGLGREIAVSWAFAVLLGVRKGKVVQDELLYDPTLVTRDGEWFLPKKGEWVAPQTLGELGIELPMEPALPEPVLLDVLANEESHLTRNLDATGLQGDVVERLWYLLATRIQAPEDSPRREFLDKHIRSIGWSLFFEGAKDAMLVHSMVIDLLSSFVHKVPGDGRAPDDYISGVEDSADLRKYRTMATTLHCIWNKTGTWLVP